MHEPKTDDVEYLPAPHSAHRLAPVLAPLLVIEPAPHGVHAATVDALEYVPAAHAIHELAPEAVPMLVRDPAKHTLQ
jgi:hypothetical protein